MRKRAALIVVVLVSLPLLACSLASQVADSGELETREYDIDGFRGIDAGNAFQIEVTQGDEYHVDVTSEARTFRYIQVERRGDNLRLSLSTAGWFPFGQSSTLRARITMPELEYLELSGATSCELQSFEANDIEVNVSGASRLRGELRAERVVLEVSGASTMDLDGSMGQVIGSVSGASTLDLHQAPVAEASIDASGASTVRLDVSSTLAYRLSGASTLRYNGEPEVLSAEVSGASRVSKE